MIMADKVYEGEHAYIELAWKDKEGDYVDPGAASIDIYNEDGTKVVVAQAMSKVGGSVSTYEYKYATLATAVPDDKTSVTYLFVGTATVSGDIAIIVGTFTIHAVG
jgi:hypothetical protein